MLDPARAAPGLIVRQVAPCTRAPLLYFLPALLERRTSTNTPWNEQVEGLWEGRPRAVICGGSRPEKHRIV